MDIREALDALSGIIDTLYGMGVLTEEEEKTLDNIETTFEAYIKAKEKEND